MQAEGKWTVWDVMAVELECAEFLHGLVRLLKPELVVESGAGRGMASLYIARALKENKLGRLVSFEPLEQFAAEARARLAPYQAEVLPGSSLGYASEPPDLVFLDSGPDTRPAEIDQWLPQGVPLVIHDAHRYELPGGVLFPTARGLWLRL
jgi:predicted O-methyltransferase YrrM